MTIKKPNGEALRTMNLLIAKVGPIKLIMEIQSRIRTIFMTLFVLKVSWMTMMKMSGETVMIVKVSPVKRIM